MLDAQTLADRYVAAWNERDADRRRKAVAALWAPDGQRPGGAREYGVLGGASLDRTKGMSGMTAPGFAPPGTPAGSATS